MFNLPISFISGASFIAKNVAQFQSECAAMATVPAIHESVKQQLLAASVAKSSLSVNGKYGTNSHLNESNWRPFAEVIGMTSPKSTKLLIPTGVSSEFHKHECMAHWLITGVYSSIRVDGKGGSRAIKDDVELFARGLLAKGHKVQVRPIPEFKLDQFELDL